MTLIITRKDNHIISLLHWQCRHEMVKLNIPWLILWCTMVTYHNDNFIICTTVKPARQWCITCSLQIWTPFIGLKPTHIQKPSKFPQIDGSCRNALVPMEKFKSLQLVEKHSLTMVLGGIFWRFRSCHSSGNVFKSFSSWEQAWWGWWTMQMGWRVH